MLTEELTIEELMAIYAEDSREEGMERGREEGIEQGREEGIGLGMERGREEGRSEIARNALAEGLPIDLIQKLTGLDAEALQQLASQ